MKLLPCFVWLCLPVLLPATLLVGAEKVSDPRQPPGHLSETQKAHWSPLGLPRLRPQVPAGKGAALDVSGYEVDALNLAANQRPRGSGPHRSHCPPDDRDCKVWRVLCLQVYKTKSGSNLQMRADCRSVNLSRHEWLAT